MPGSTTTSSVEEYDKVVGVAMARMMGEAMLSWWDWHLAYMDYAFSVIDLPEGAFCVAGCEE